MASSATATVDEYLAELLADRREAIQAVRDLVNRHLPAGYEEGIQYGMIGWYAPRVATFADRTTADHSRTSGSRARSAR